MSGIGFRIKEMRARRGWSQTQLAKAAGGLSYQTIQGLENGKARGTKHLLAIARALDVTPEWLETGDPSVAPAEPRPMNPRHAEAGAFTLRSYPVEIDASDRIPVLGLAECGPDGWGMFNGEVIETIPRPANLKGVPKAYAVYITGTSMVPRYQPGELVHIHPGKPVSIGAYVLVQKKPKGDGDSPMAVVKELSRRSPTKTTLRQLNPENTFDLKNEEILTIHRVVGSSEAG